MARFLFIDNIAMVVLVTRTDYGEATLSDETGASVLFNVKDKRGGLRAKRVSEALTQYCKQKRLGQKAHLYP